MSLWTGLMTPGGGIRWVAAVLIWTGSGRVGSWGIEAEPGLMRVGRATAGLITVVPRTTGGGAGLGPPDREVAGGSFPT